MKKRASKTFEESAKIYGVTARAVQKWAAIGEDSGDPCPYDLPESMPEWFRRQDMRVPDGVAKAAIKNRGVAALAAPRELPSPPEGEPGSYDTLLQSSRHVHEVAMKLYHEACESGDADQIGLLQKNLIEAAKNLRSVEKDSPAILKAQGELVQVAEVRTELQRICGAVPQLLRAALEKLLVASIPDRSARKAAARSIVEEACVNLKSCRYTVTT